MIGRRLGVAAALLVAAPALIGIGHALAAAGGHLHVLSEPVVWRSLGFSIWIGAASTALATAAAVAVAVTFRETRPLAQAGRALAVLPLPIPHLVAGVLGLLVLAPSGLLARLGHAVGIVTLPADMPVLVYDPRGIGIILTLAWKETPFLALVAVSLLATRGAACEEAARTLGAAPWTAFRHVTWPLLWRGLSPAVVAVFAFVAGTWEVTALLAPSDPAPLPVLTWERYTGVALERRGEAFVLVLVAMGLSALVVTVHEWARTRWERNA